MTWWLYNDHVACPTCSELEVKMEADDVSVQALGKIEVYNEENKAVLLPNPFRSNQTGCTT